MVSQYPEAWHIDQRGPGWQHGAAVVLLDGAPVWDVRGYDTRSATLKALCGTSGHSCGAEGHHSDQIHATDGELCIVTLTGDEVVVVPTIVAPNMTMWRQGRLWGLWQGHGQTDWAYYERDEMWAHLLALRLQGVWVPKDALAAVKNGAVAA